MSRTTPRRPQDRRRAYRWGLAAESLAAGFLRLKGYRIIASRYRTPAGEIDLIARRGRTVAFVEVKARKRLDIGEEAVSSASEQRIVRAADLFIARHPRLADYIQRFDLIVVVPWRLPVHLQRAFDP